MTERTVPGYPFDKVRQKEQLKLKTYEYDLPFNYENIKVWRKSYHGREFHGMELFTRNKSSIEVRFKNAEPDKWTRLRMTTIVMPLAEKGALWLWFCNLVDDAVICIADAFAGLVPNEWDENDQIPAGTKNLIKNPTFNLSPDKKCPDGWKMKEYSETVIKPCSEDDAGRKGIQVEKMHADLYAEFPVSGGTRVVLEVWVKSNKSNPGTVLITDRWFDKNGKKIPGDAPDCIVVDEDEPIVRVAVIGSACTPPGYVAVEAEPCEQFYHRGDMVRCTAPVRFRQNNLWGMHLRADQWMDEMGQSDTYEELSADLLKAYPFMKGTKVKADYSQFPSSGMSCAVFEIPKSKRIIITGGSESPVWTSDNAPSDDHYSFRTIRTTVVSGK